MRGNQVDTDTNTFNAKKVHVCRLLQGLLAMRLWIVGAVTEPICCYYQKIGRVIGRSQLGWTAIAIVNKALTPASAFNAEAQSKSEKEYREERRLEKKHRHSNR